MFGGKLEANGGNVTDELWVFNIPGRTWQRKIPVVGPPGQTQIYAVEGHSAHCILLEGGEAIMLVIFGYSPIYSYISNVQEYNLSKSRLRSRASWHFFSILFSLQSVVVFQFQRKQWCFFPFRIQHLGDTRDQRRHSPRRLWPQQHVWHLYWQRVCPWRLQGSACQQVRPSGRPLPLWRWYQDMVNQNTNTGYM